MTVDCDRYRENYNSIHIMLKDLSLEDRHHKVGVISASTHVPLIAVICYCLEMFGKDDVLEEQLERLKKFYRVTELKGFKGV